MARAVALGAVLGCVFHPGCTILGAFPAKNPASKATGGASRLPSLGPAGTPGQCNKGERDALDSSVVGPGRPSVRRLLPGAARCPRRGGAGAVPRRPGGGARGRRSGQPAARRSTRGAGGRASGGDDPHAAARLGGGQRPRLCWPGSGAAARRARARAGGPVDPAHCRHRRRPALDARAPRPQRRRDSHPGCGPAASPAVSHWRHPDGIDRCAADLPGGRRR